jgi:hypothetical protein
VKGEREKAEGQGLKDYLKAGIRSQESEDRRKRLVEAEGKRLEMIGFWIQKAKDWPK